MWSRATPSRFHAFALFQVSRAPAATWLPSLLGLLRVGGAKREALMSEREVTRPAHFNERTLALRQLLASKYVGHSSLSMFHLPCYDAKLEVGNRVLLILFAKLKHICKERRNTYNQFDALITRIKQEKNRWKKTSTVPQANCSADWIVVSSELWRPNCNQHHQH